VEAIGGGRDRSDDGRGDPGERLPDLGAFDAVLAAAALESRATALVSADRAFASVPRLRFVVIGSRTLDELIAP
jgi:hypothetical protein